MRARHAALAAVPRGVPVMQADRPFVGVLLMLGFCTLAPLGDAVAKIVGDALPLAQVVAVRFSVQALVLVPLAWITGRSLAMSPRVLRLTAVRTVLHVVGISMLFLSLRYLPLADAIAIAFVMPFVTLLLGSVVYGEHVGPRRLIGCCVGFAGTLLVVQPSFASVGLPALLPLGAAVLFSVFMLVTRQIAREADPIVLQAMSGVMAALGLVPLAVLADGRGWEALDWVAAGPGAWGLLVLIGVLGTGAHLMMTWSLRFAPASTLAPMQYLEIPIATLAGFVLFADLPNGLAAVGIVVTTASGLYVIHRERRSAALPSGAEM